MNRIKIEDALLATGVPAGTKGFNYIADAVEIFDERGTSIGITKELYPEIARKNNATPSSVERAIRHAFEIARTKWSSEIAGKYIGTVNCNNSSSIKQLHMMLKRE